MLNEEYKKLINPAILAKDMDEKEFKRWLSLGEEHPMYITHLEDALKAFELEEMFEHCILIKEKIDEKKKQRSR